ncbi:MAG TPA: S8 family serine peptidase [Burkholderiales bacterium]|nr:S8 family serine peptidase [Burkholderiales bacterium]
MTRLVGPFVSVLLVLAAGCSAVTPTRSDSRVPDAASERQLLVMVIERPIRHYRPGASVLSAYGPSASRARTLRVARDLARDYGLNPVSDWPMPALGVRCFLMELPPGQSAQEVAGRLAADPRVESAQPQHVFRVAAHDVPPGMLETGARALELDALHRMATGKNVTVAQIDTGVDTQHPDLHGQFAAERNFVDGVRLPPEVHGTAVAGIIVAKPDKRVGIVGVAPGARLLVLRACWEPADGAGLCTSFALAKAIQFALIEHVQVLNLSLTGPHDGLLERLLDKAVQDRVIVVGASSSNASNFPAAHPGVIAVAASGLPSPPDGAVLAPGRDILTTAPDASWGFFSGASFAAAYVSGLTALMLERSPRIAPASVRALLMQNHAAGTGSEPVLDACAALADAAPERDCDCCTRASARGPRGRARTPTS